MRIAVYFIFLPTDALLKAALPAEEMGLAEPSVWTTAQHDRTGLEHSQKDVERAFWAEFRAQLFYENESATQRQFRERCNELGFSGCWTVIKTHGGGPAGDLIKAAARAEQYLKDQEGAS